MLLLAGSMVVPRVAQAQSSSDAVTDYHSVIPLGIEGFLLHPARRSLYLIGSAASPYFEGWREIDHGQQHTVRAPDGSPVRFFPDHVEFRITASAARDLGLTAATYPLDVGDNVNDYLLGLWFRVKIFHGLDARTVEPDQVELIGMPREIAYDERVYRVAFDLPRVPIEDRIVLEVLDPAGERICKFHLDF